MPDFIVTLVTSVLPAGITGFCFFLIERNIKKEADKREKQEHDRQAFNLVLLKSVNATMALGEATCMAMRNGKCNGETERALNYMRTIKDEQKDFINRKSVEAIVD